MFVLIRKSPDFLIPGDISASLGMIIPNLDFFIHHLITFIYKIFSFFPPTSAAQIVD